MERMETWRKVAGAILTALAVVMLVMALGCAVQPRVLVVRYDASAIGTTTCSDEDPRTVIIAVPSQVSPQDYYFVHLHEVTHVKQMARNGGCRLLEERISADPLFRLRMESEAWCVMAEAMIEAGRPVIIDSVAVRLQRLYSEWVVNFPTAPKLSVDSVRAMLPCGGQHESPP